MPSVVHVTARSPSLPVSGTQSAWRRPRPRLLAWLGLMGIAEFMAGILALHLTSLHHAPGHMSQFANTRFWLLWNLAIFSFTVGGAALCIALRPHLGRSMSQRLGTWMLWLSVVGAVLLTAFPMDAGEQAPTLAGAIHGGAALTMFMLLGLAMATLAPAFRSNPAWRSFGMPSLVIGILVSGMDITYMVASVGHLALAAFAQRIMVAFIAAWFVLLAVRLLGARDLPGSARAGAARRRTAQGRFAAANAAR